MSITGAMPASYIHRLMIVLIFFNQFKNLLIKQNTK